MKVWHDPRTFAVCLGMDAFRLATGRLPKNFTPMQIVGLLTKAADKAQPLRTSQAILDCHAQFGGDIEDMQRKYDQHYEVAFEGQAAP
jgi:hypothetical protein